MAVGDTVTNVIQALVESRPESAGALYECALQAKRQAVASTDTDERGRLYDLAVDFAARSITLSRESGDALDAGLTALLLAEVLPELGRAVTAVYILETALTDLVMFAQCTPRLDRPHLDRLMMDLRLSWANLSIVSGVATPDRVRWTVDLLFADNQVFRRTVVTGVYAEVMGRIYAFLDAPRA